MHLSDRYRHIRQEETTRSMPMGVRTLMDWEPKKPDIKWSTPERRWLLKNLPLRTLLSLVAVLLLWMAFSNQGIRTTDDKWTGESFFLNLLSMESRLSANFMETFALLRGSYETGMSLLLEDGGFLKAILNRCTAQQRIKYRSMRLFMVD